MYCDCQSIICFVIIIVIVVITILMTSWIIIIWLSPMMWMKIYVYLLKVDTIINRTLVEMVRLNIYDHNVLGLNFIICGIYWFIKKLSLKKKHSYNNIIYFV